LKIPTEVVKFSTYGFNYPSTESTVINGDYLKVLTKVVNVSNLRIQTIFKYEFILRLPTVFHNLEISESF